MLVRLVASADGGTIAYPIGNGPGSVTTFSRCCDRPRGKLVENTELGALLQTIDGIGPTTAARILAELGDPST